MATLRRGNARGEAFDGALRLGCHAAVVLRGPWRGKSVDSSRNQSGAQATRCADYNSPTRQLKIDTIFRIVGEKHAVSARTVYLEVIRIGQHDNDLEVELVHVDGRDEQMLQQVIELGDSHQRTLGFFPQAAFRRAAESRTLIAAVRSEQVVGYVLYGLPRQIIRITHLCIAENARGRGIARRLVDAISERHADRFGITLRCRNDYPAHHLWPQLGFIPQGERPGRRRRGSVLTVWWRDHGHPNLFSSAESLGLLRVVMDVNVFLDLESGSERQRVAESRALADDWLAHQRELVSAHPRAPPDAGRTGEIQPAPGGEELPLSGGRRQSG